MLKLPKYAPALAVAGYIKNGHQVPVMDRRGNQLFDDYGNPKFRGEQLDHYVVTTLERDPVSRNYIPDQAIMDKLEKGPDGKVRRIPIFVSSDNFDVFIPTELKGRNGSKHVVCRGNGETARRIEIERGRKISQWREMKCPCPWFTHPGQGRNGTCKAYAELRCKIALPDAITIGSVYAFYTGSEIGIPKMLGGFSEIQALIGTLVWVPMWLELRAEHVQPEGYVKTVYSSFVHIRGKDYREIQERSLAMAEASRNVQRAVGRTTLLPLPAMADRDLDDDDGDDDSTDEPYGSFYETSASEPAKGDAAEPASEPEPDPSVTYAPGPEQPSVHADGTSEAAVATVSDGPYTEVSTATAESESPKIDHKLLLSAMAEYLFVERGKQLGPEESKDAMNALWHQLREEHRFGRWADLSSAEITELVTTLRKEVTTMRDADAKRDKDKR